MVGDEAVDEAQRHAGERQRGIEIFVAVGHLLITVATADGGYLVAVLQQGALYGVGVVLALQIHKLCTEITHGTAFVGHILDQHVAGHGDLLVLVHHQVVVAVEQACDMRHIGDGGGEVIQVELRKADGEVLQQGGVLILGIDLYTGLVVGHQTDVGL